MNSIFAGIFFAASSAFGDRDYLPVVREQVPDVLADDAVADFKATLRCP